MCVCVQIAQAEAEKTTKRADKKKELDELNELFKPVVAAQKVSKGNKPAVCDRTLISITLANLTFSIVHLKLPVFSACFCVCVCSVY